MTRPFDEAAHTQAGETLRPCKACDGAGVFRAETDYDCSDVRSVLGSAYDFRDCRACLGSGEVQESIPVADALADAETLIFVARAIPKQARHRLNGLLRARDLGVCAASEIKYGGGWLLPHITAADAARIMFRAVPGLRA